MSIIHDIYNKVAHWKPITIYASAEKLTCRKCGKQYISRGKFDTGICRECEKEENAYCIGGVYDGEKANDSK